MIYVKWGAIALVLIAYSGLWFYLGTLRGDETAAQAQTAQEAAHAAQLSSLATAWQSRELAYEAQTQRYTDEIETLRNTRAQPLPGTPLRVCFTTPGPLVPAAGGGDREAAATGALPSGDAKVPRSGGDIRAGLFAIADEADETVAECRRTQPKSP